MDIMKFRYEGEGFKPLLQCDGWQVSLLNYDAAVDEKNIRKVERHVETDEVFLLLSGSAILIAAEYLDGHWHLHAETMEAGTIYNITEKMWHYITMDQTAKALILENRDTHLNDVEYAELPQDDVTLLRSMLAERVALCPGWKRA